MEPVEIGPFWVQVSRNKFITKIENMRGGGVLVSVVDKYAMYKEVLFFVSSS